MTSLNPSSSIQIQLDHSSSLDHQSTLNQSLPLNQSIPIPIPIPILHSRSHSLHLQNSHRPSLNLLTTIHNPLSSSSSSSTFSSFLSSNQIRPPSQDILPPSFSPPKLAHPPLLSLKHQAIRASHRRNSSLTSLGSSPIPLPASSPLPIQSETVVPSPLPESDSPLALIAARLPALPVEQQEPVRRTLKLITALALPPPFPLPHAWTLFFSDTSQTAKTPVRAHHSAHAQRETSLLRAAEYQSGMAEVFRGVGDVESLCGALGAFKMRVAVAVRAGALCAPAPHALAHGRKDGPLVDALALPGNGLGLAVLRPQQNLHFFRVGVNPVWEDPWNAKGGRLTISPSLAMLDSTFEALVLLIAGGVIECDARRPGQPDGGRVVGVVGSRRHRGDRIEIWLSGPMIGSAPQEDWIKSVQTIIAKEIGTAESKIARFKKHLP